MKKIVGPSACPSECAHDVISIVILEHEWSLGFKAQILVIDDCFYHLKE